MPVSPAAGMYQQYFHTMLNVTGGSGATTWAVVGGALPAGLLADSSGSISGTPASIGTFTITVQATDANWPTHQATASVSLVISAPPFTASMPVAPAGQVGLGYQLAGSTSGQVGVVSWSVASGSLPPGLTLNAATGLIAGIPTTSGVFSATVQARDSFDASRVGALPVGISVAPSGIRVATSTLPAGRVYRAYTAPLVASGGPGVTSWSLAGGSLPAGLSLATNGTISGTPTSVGNATFTVRATDSGWTANVSTAALTLSVASGEIVLYAADAVRVAGAWSMVADATAAGGKRMANPDAGAAK